MHIAYIHQYFATRSGTTGTRSYEFAKRWIDAGHRVTMVTSTAQLTGSDLGTAACSGTSRRFNVEGIDVIAFNIFYHQTMGYAKRIWSFVRFLFFASLITMRLKDIDVVYATSTPLTVAIPALFLKWFRGIPFVFEVRDQWPESVIELGVLRNIFLIKVLLWLEKYIYDNSSAVVAVSEGMAQDIQKIAGPAKPVHVIPNGADLDLFHPDIDVSSVRQKKGWNNKLVLLHAGAMGKINGLEFVINAADRVKHQENILFVLVGQGSRKEYLEKMVRDFNVINVEMLSSVPKQELHLLLSAADVIMVIIGNFPIIEKHASLNKFYDGLSAGKPVLLNYSGWQRKLIEREGAGWGCKLCDVDEFADKVIKLNHEKERLALMGQNARKIAEGQFNRDVLAQQALSVLLSIRKQ